MKCPYCGTEAKLDDSAVVYRKSYGPIWICGQFPKCDSYVGCHPGTHTPLGRMANAELRHAKMAAHQAFDVLWKDKQTKNLTRNQVRNIAYRWLASNLEIKFEDCHIGMFDVETCQRVVQVCKKEITPYVART